MFCFVCMKTLQERKLSSNNIDTVFVVDGYVNWKPATDNKKGFTRHALSNSHKEAVDRLINIPKTQSDILAKFCLHNTKKENTVNRIILLKILSYMIYLW